MTDLSNAQVLAELRAICGGHERATELLDELTDRLNEEDWVVPTEVMSLVRQKYPQRRTIEAVSRRCRFAHRVWSEKYGPFNFEQGRYAIELMLYIINSSAGHAQMYGRFDEMLNHETVDAGFKRRRDGEPEVKFDAMELL